MEFFLNWATNVLQDSVFNVRTTSYKTQPLARLIHLRSVTVFIVF